MELDYGYLCPLIATGFKSKYLVALNVVLRDTLFTLMHAASHKITVTNENILKLRLFT